MLEFRYYRVISKALLGFSVPDHLPSMTAHYNWNVDNLDAQNSICKFLALHPRCALLCSWPTGESMSTPKPAAFWQKESAKLKQKEEASRARARVRVTSA